MIEHINSINFFIGHDMVLSVFDVFSSPREHNTKVRLCVFFFVKPSTSLLFFHYNDKL